MTVSEDSPINRMFKWLKEKKKTRRTGRLDGRVDGQTDSSVDDYGFHHGQKTEKDDYGFNNCVNVNVLKMHNNKSPATDPTFHIYEEILDLPEVLAPANKVPVIGSTNGAFRRIGGQTTGNMARPLPASYSNRSLPVPEGPYMVVPIVNHSLVENTEKDVCDDCRVSNVNTSIGCTCHVQWLTREPPYNPPWDRQPDPAKHKPSEEVSLFQVLQPKCRARGSPHPPDYITSSSSECSSGSTGSSSAGNDTGYEYDINTSGESDAVDSADYKSVLEKVQHNLLLTEQVRNIIHSLDGEVMSDSSNTTLDRTSCSIRTVSSLSDHTSCSIRTASSLSGHSSAPTVSGSFVSDQGTLADNSESDDSGGDFEYPGANDTSSGSSRVTSGAHCSKGVKFHRARRHRQKQNGSYHRKCHVGSACTRQEEESVIAEDTELYLLPANKKDSCSNIRVFGNPLVPPQQTLIYQDPQRHQSKAGNRLLSDLIRMNYDKQHMVL